MRRLRFSIAGLVGLVMCCGVGFAALRSHTMLWSGGLYLATMGVLFFSFLGIIHRRTEKRAFWVGFAIFGWGYYCLLFGPYASLTSETFLTSSLLLTLYQFLRLPYDYGTSAGPPNSPSDGHPPYQTLFDYVSPGGPDEFERFMRIGHCLFLLVFAVIGGVVSRRLYLARVESQPKTNPEAPEKAAPT